MPSRLTITSDTLTPGLHSFAPKLEAALTLAMKFHAPRVAGWMKDNAHWTDRTSNARNGLDTEPFNTPGHHGIWLFHQVPYGIWLEVAHSGKYKIIEPAIIDQGRAVMLTVAAIFAKMA